MSHFLPNFVGTPASVHPACAGVPAGEPDPRWRGLGVVAAV